MQNRSVRYGALASREMWMQYRGELQDAVKYDEMKCVLLRSAEQCDAVQLEYACA